MIVFDQVAWFVGLTGGTLLRFNFDLGAVEFDAVLLHWAIVIPIYFGLGWLLRLHHGRASVGSLDEMMILGLVVATSGIALFAINLLPGMAPLPRTVPIGAAILTLVVMAWGRATWRRVRESAGFLPAGPHTKRALIAGAGEGAQQLVRSMLRDRSATWSAVGLLDDDPLKRYRRIHGVPVLGTTRDVAAAAARTEADSLVIAIPSADDELVRELSRMGADAGLKVKVVPGLDDLLGGHVDIHDVRDIDVTDLLGRHQIETDIDSIAGYLTGKRVLVTGAGGSIGSELCRQIYRFGPEELIMLDRDESALHSVQLSIHGKAMLDTDEVVLGDIRDTAFLNDLFESRRPHVVFHAAALKHLPMLEQYPGEAVKTNVWGTLSVLEAAKAFDVERFVNISTDKAANPTSVLGYSKRIAEALTASVARDTAGTFLSVRFGNVLGSRGSVLTAFTAQIAAGGPVTVTHPEVTRFFMTVQEAVQLVIQAAAIGRDGEALVLDMGQPVKIDDVARQLIELSGRSINIEYTGLRHAEKMNEELFGDGERDERHVHPLVAHTCVPPMDPLDARELDPWAPGEGLVWSLAKCCEQLSLAPPELVSHFD